MMQNKFSNKPSFSWYTLIFAFFVMNLVARPAFAALSVADMIVNIAATVPQLMLFTTALAYVLGFYFVAHGLLLLKKYAEQRTMMSGDAKMSAPLLYLFVGAALIYLPSAVQSGITTFWLHPNPYGYDTGNKDQWAVFLGACFNIIQLVGVIAFIRGLVILAHMGGQGGHQATFGRAAAHIVGGIFCIDIYDFVQAVFVTFGLGPLPTT